MSSDAASVSSISGASIISIADMTPTTRHFVSLNGIVLGIHKKYPGLTSEPFQGWHSQRKFVDAGAIVFGRKEKKGDNFLEMCFLRCKSSQ